MTYKSVKLDKNFTINNSVNFEIFTTEFARILSLFSNISRQLRLNRLRFSYFITTPSGLPDDVCEVQMLRDLSLFS